jgi:DNA-binding CsgD family transcriptional regulator
MHQACFGHSGFFNIPAERGFARAAPALACIGPRAGDIQGNGASSMKKHCIENTANGGEWDMEMPERFSTLLLHLYHDAIALPERQFQTKAFADLKKLVPFDAAWWGVGVIDVAAGIDYAGPKISDIHLENMPQNTLENYENFKQFDTLAKATALEPGKTFNVCVREWYPEAYWPYLDIFGYRQVLTTLIVTPFTKFTTGVTLYRADPDRPFSEQERRIKQALMPHWAAALSRARIAPWLRDVASSLQYPGTALVDTLGTLRYASGDFREILQYEWPDWRGPLLPEPLHRFLSTNMQTKYLGAHIVAKIVQMSNMARVQVRPKCLADQLSHQQFKVAKYSADGLSFKEIARATDLSPATVRTYLRNIYSRLGVNNKIELARMLQEVE